MLIKRLRHKSQLTTSPDKEINHRGLLENEVLRQVGSAWTTNEN